MKIKIMALSVLTTAVFLSACEEEKPVKRPDQLFRPVQFDWTWDAETGTMTLLWTPIDMATYLVEISRDSFNLDLRSFEVEQAHVAVSDLWGEAKYWARVKSVSLDPKIRDSDFRNTTFTAPLDDIFFDPDFLTPGHILLKWDSSIPVTHLVMNIVGEDPETIPLSPAEIENGEKEISGLDTSLSYEFRLYQGERLRGRGRLVFS